MTGQSKPKDYGCQHCDMLFAYAKSKDKHEEKCMKNPMFKGHPCEFCLLLGIPQYYKTLDGLKTHKKRQHTKQPKPECSWCFQAFSSLQVVKQHEKICRG